MVTADQRQVSGVLVELGWNRRHRQPDLGRRGSAAQRELGLRAETDLGTSGRMRGAADEHPARRGLGLQAGRGVDHVAGDDRLPAVVRRGHVDERLTGGDADPERPAARSTGTAFVGSGKRALQVEPGADARTASASVATGAPNSTIAASPMYFSTTPPYWRTTRRTVAKKSV